MPNGPTKHLFWASLILALGITAVLISGYRPYFFNSLSVYGVHGLAHANFGFLSADWYVSTLDPMPIFSAIIAFAFRMTDLADAHGLLFFTYVTLAGIYFTALTFVASRVFGYEMDRWLVALTAIVLVNLHGELIDSIVGRLSGVDFRTLFTAGVSGQDLLTSYLQPSSFAVLLTASIAFFLMKRRITASALICAATLMHPGYLYTGAALTIAMMIIIWRQDTRLRNAILFGGLTLVLVLPIVIYTLYQFGEADSVIRAEGHRILAVERAPHHASPLVWMRSIEPWLQIALIAAAVFVSRRNALAVLIGIPAALTGALSLYVVLSNDYFVANVMPWRAFTFITPLATATMVGFVISKVSTKWPQVRQRAAITLVAVGGLLSVLLTVNGGRTLIQASAEVVTSPYQPLFEFVRQNTSKGDLYLIPPTTTGAVVSFAEFRVLAWAPVLVDEKSNPFSPRDMVEWKRRMQLAIPVFNGEQLVNCQALADLVAVEPITHVVSRTGTDGCSGWVEIYEDRNFVALRRESSAGS